MPSNAHPIIPLPSPLFSLPYSLSARPVTHADFRSYPSWVGHSVLYVFLSPSRKLHVFANHSIIPLFHRSCAFPSLSLIFPSLPIPLFCCPAHCLNLPVSLSPPPIFEGRTFRELEATRRYRGAVRSPIIAPGGLLRPCCLFRHQFHPNLFVSQITFLRDLESLPGALRIPRSNIRFSICN